LRLGGSAAVATPLFAGGLLSSCGSDDNEGTSAESSRLSLVSWKLTGPSTEPFGAFVDDLEARLEAEHEGLSLVRTAEPIDSYNDKLIASFSTGGDVADVIHLPGRDLVQFARAGWLEPLGDLPGMDDYMAKFVDLQRTACVVDDQVYGALVEPYAVGLAHNAAMLDEAGVDVPTTPDELVSAAQALTSQDDAQYGMALPVSGGSDVVMAVAFFLIGLGTHWTDDDGNPIANTARVVEGVELYREILESGSAPGIQSSASSNQLLYERKVAMHINGPWVVGGAQGTAVEEEISAARVPFPGVAGGVSNVLALPKDGDANELAWEFIREWLSPEGQIGYSLASGSVPPDPAHFDGELAETSPYLAVYADELPSAVERIPVGFEAEFNRFVDITSPILESIFVGGEDVRSALDTLQGELEGLAEEL
jgi:multiple sugar transport system substrate-binding protein